ncbi:MAG: Ig-like domain-containing protein [Verrucomicrobiales bacterium]
MALACWLIAGAGASAEVSISLSADGRSFVATGTQAGDELEVRVAGGDDLPAMAGALEPIDGGLRFTPQFPLSPGLTYLAAAGGAEQEFAIPELDQTPVARVAKVFPSAPHLPENLLKFYIHFSEPMAIGEASTHVRLLGPSGEEVALPFLELAEELWDPEGKRLTVFFDPGRVKRGLKPHEDEGRALLEGEDYELQIDAAWRDARGRSMVEGYSKRFRVTAADYEKPDASLWVIEPPAAATRKPVTIRFPEPLDHGLLERVVVVYDSEGRALPGVVEVGPTETLWTWTPDEPWEAGDYRVVVEALLEDLAGNSVARLFEEIRGVKEVWNIRGGRFIRLPFSVDAR